MSNPYIPFYTSDFIAGTSGLTASEKGVYITLLCLMYEDETPVSMRDKSLARRCGCTVGALNKAIETLQDEGKIQVSGKGIWSQKCEKHIASRHKKSSSGKIAAEKRWEKSQLNQQIDDADAMQTQCQPEPEPEPYKETPKPPLPDKELFDLEFSTLLSKIETIVPKSRLSVFKLRIALGQECRRHEVAKITSALFHYYQSVKDDDPKFIKAPHKVLDERLYENFFNASLTPPPYFMKELYHLQDMGEIDDDEFNRRIEIWKKEAAA